MRVRDERVTGGRRACGVMMLVKRPKTRQTEEWKGDSGGEGLIQEVEKYYVRINQGGGRKKSRDRGHRGKGTRGKEERCAGNSTHYSLCSIVLNHSFFDVFADDGVPFQPNDPDEPCLSLVFV